MSESIRKQYEGMYIISATLSDDARNKALERIQESITSRGGEIVKVHDMGKKRLAYSIREQREGHYYLIYFTLFPNHVKDLWKEYHLNEDLLRFMTYLTDTVLDKLEFKSLAEVKTGAGESYVKKKM